MRALAGSLIASLLVACSPTVMPTPAPARDLIVPTTVPNGRVEVVVRSEYAVGQPVRATVRLLPSSGTLRGPIDAYVQASGFHGTAIVRHLDASPVTASGLTSGTVELVWDMRDDGGKAVIGDDYSLVLVVLDDQGRRTTVGATLVVR